MANPYSCTEVYIKPRNEKYRRLVVGNYSVLYEINEKAKQIVIYRVVYAKSDYLNFYGG